MTTEAQAQVQTRQRPWWLTLITGISALILGAFFLWGAAGPAEKLDVYLFLVTFLGIWWLMQGIFDIVAIFIDHSMWGWKLFMGIVSIAAGWYILAYPLAAAVALPRIMVLVLGIWGLMYGIILLIMAFSGGGWGAGILGVLGILFGIALMADYGKLFSGLAMLWSMAVLGVIFGIALIFQAFRQRKATA
jgi:uncharacterized membrane protein HdeD (DUF308 family)